MSPPFISLRMLQAAAAGGGVGDTLEFGSTAVFNNAQTQYTKIAFDPSNAGRFVVAYRDKTNSGYGTAAVGTLSGTTISMGPEYVFKSTSMPAYPISLEFDPNNTDKFVISFRDPSNNDYGTVVVGTVSGTSISYGSTYVYHSLRIESSAVSFDPNNSNKLVVAFMQNYGYQKGYAIVGTVSGTAVSFGSAAQFNAGYAERIDVAFDPNNTGKFVVTYKDGNNSNYGTAVVGTVSGTSISYGSTYVFNTGNTSDTSIMFDPNNSGKFVIAYTDYGNSGYGTAIIGTVSGTSISYGSEYIFNSSTSFFSSVEFDPNNEDKIVIAYIDSGHADVIGAAIAGTVTGSVIEYGDTTAFNNINTGYSALSFDPNNDNTFVVAYAHLADNTGTVRIGTIS